MGAGDAERVNVRCYVRSLSSDSTAERIIPSAEEGIDTARDSSCVVSENLVGRTYPLAVSHLCLIPLRTS